MNLIWHIAKKDLRRFWLPTLLLCVVAGLRFGVGLSLLHANGFDPDWFGRMAIYSSVLQGFGFLITFLLAAAVIQEDAAAAPAFWQTRPIVPFTLLMAKALAVFVLFGLVPVGVTLPWWLGCGLGGAQLVHAAGEVFALQALAVLLALPWAAVTGDFGRFLLWTLVAAVGAATFVLMFAAQVLVMQGNYWGSGVTRLLLVVGIAAAGGLAATVHQFATRRTERSIAVIVIAACCAAGVARWSRWDASKLWAPQPMAPGPLAAGVRIAFDQAEAFTTVQPDLRTLGNVRIRVDGIPADHRLENTYSDQVVRWPDGIIIRDAQSELWGSVGGPGGGGFQHLLGIATQPSFQIDPSWEQYGKRHFLYREELFHPPALGQEPIDGFMLSLPLSLAKRLMAEPASLTATYWFRLMEPEVVGRDRLAVGSEIGRGSVHTRVAGVVPDPTGAALRVDLVERHPAFAGSEFLDPLRLDSPDDEPAYVFISDQGSFAREGLNEVRLPVTVANVAIVLRQDVFRSMLHHWDAAAHDWAMDPGKFGGGILAEIHNRSVDTFSLPLNVARFSWAEPKTAVMSRIGLVTVSGAVERPVIADLYAGETPVRAIRDAGGFSEVADMAHVVLIRKAPDGTTTQISVDLKAYLDGRSGDESLPELQAGDVIEVPTRP
jgi:hypothetical protein